MSDREQLLTQAAMDLNDVAALVNTMLASGPSSVLTHQAIVMLLDVLSAGVALETIYVQQPNSNSKL